MLSRNTTIYKRILITGIFLLQAGFWVLAPSAKASGLCLEASGFGYAGANGTYTDTGSTNAGEPYYTNGTELLYLRSDTNAFINPTIQVAGDGVYQDYYLGSASGSSYMVGTYTAQSGTAPGGTVSIVSCGGGGGGVSDVIPTTTPEAIIYAQTQDNLYHGFMLFLITTGGITAFFVTKLRRKK